METVLKFNSNPPLVAYRPWRETPPAESFRLRYRVFCQEKGFFDHQAYQDEYEIDSYDRHAIHIMVTRRNAKKNGLEEVIGTTRVIPHTKCGLPTEKFCDNLYSLLPECVQSAKMGEISRLCIAREHRLRSISLERTSCTPGNNQAHRGYSPVLVFLLKGIHIATRELGIQYVIASMEGGLARILLKNGIALTPLLDDWFDYYGNVKVYGSSIKEIMNGLKKNAPAVYEIILSSTAFGDEDHHRLHLFCDDSQKKFSECIARRS